MAYIFIVVIIIIFACLPFHKNNSMDDPKEQESLRRSQRSRIVRARLASDSPEQKLIEALRTKDKAKIEECKDAIGRPLDASDNTAFHLVEDVEALELLLPLTMSKEAFNKKNLEQRTPLHVMRNLGIVQALLRAGADALILNHEGQSALHVAVAGAREPDESGYDAQDPLQNGGMALLFIEHLKISPEAINRRNRDGQTSLHIVRNMRVAQALLNAGASVAILDNRGRTPLHGAAHEQMVKFLLNNEADPKARDFCDLMPVHTLSDARAKQALVARTSCQCCCLIS